MHFSWLFDILASAVLTGPWFHWTFNATPK